VRYNPAAAAAAHRAAVEPATIRAPSTSATAVAARFIPLLYGAGAPDVTAGPLD
jgi:hypothetical protein